MKLCKDCTHGRGVLENSWGHCTMRWDMAKCAHPDFLSPVDGLPHEYCSQMRRVKCGAAGLNWEPLTEQQIASREQAMNPPKPDATLIIPYSHESERPFWQRFFSF